MLLAPTATAATSSSPDASAIQESAPLLEPESVPLLLPELPPLLLPLLDPDSNVPSKTAASKSGDPVLPPLLELKQPPMNPPMPSAQLASPA